jgi:hypothetical protein
MRYFYFIFLIEQLKKYIYANLNLLFRDARSHYITEKYAKKSFMIPIQPTTDVLYNSIKTLNFIEIWKCILNGMNRISISLLILRN